MNSLQPPAINRRPSALARESLQVAASQIGTMEQPHGSNDGPEVANYLRSVGLKPGFAWCAAFVYWCAQGASRSSGLTNPLPCTGGVLRMFNKSIGPKLQRLEAPIAADDIRPGDIFILRFSNGHGHTGFIEKVSGDCVLTVEGNTDRAGGREGIGVFAKRRKVSALAGIIRITE